MFGFCRLAYAQRALASGQGFLGFVKGFVSGSFSHPALATDEVA
jgi:hypothetical protein